MILRFLSKKFFPLDESTNPLGFFRYQKTGLLYFRDFEVTEVGSLLWNTKSLSYKSYPRPLAMSLPNGKFVILGIHNDQSISLSLLDRDIKLVRHTDLLNFRFNDFGSILWGRVASASL